MQCEKEAKQHEKEAKQQKKVRASVIIVRHQD